MTSDVTDMVDGWWDTPDREEQRRRGLRWLAGLRWWAATGAMVGVLVTIALSWDFVSTPAIVVGLVTMVAVNGVLLWRTRQDTAVGRNELLLHAAVDLFMLTWLLAWSGGVQNPLSAAYSFHVVLGALLNGRRGALFSSVASLVCMMTLWGLDQVQLLPMPALRNPPALLWAIALVTLVVGLGYLALVTAERSARERETAKVQQQDAERALGLLLEMLTALRVGVDVQDRDGRTLLQNEGNLAKDPSAAAAITRAQATLDAEPGLAVGHTVDGAIARRTTERFMVAGPDGERVIELVGLRPSHPRVSQAFLTVDRTESLMVEQRHVMLERLATLGRAMQGVAHELNTPLTTMQTLAKDLRAALAATDLPANVRADVEESLELIIEETRRCRSLTQSLLSTANESGRRRGLRAPLSEVARRAVKMVGSSDGAVLVDEDSLQVVGEVDADRVLQILMNLVQNALAASQEAPGPGPRVTVSAQVAGGLVRVQVRDRGPGLPELVRQRLFEPFVTTKPEGTGLGLYTSQQLARELGGSLDLRSAIEGGTIAELTLPSPTAA
jgi:signal transduction histidine kinase